MAEFGETNKPLTGVRVGRLYFRFSRIGAKLGEDRYFVLKVFASTSVNIQSESVRLQLFSAFFSGSRFTPNCAQEYDQWM